jgi:N-acyl-D-amino-acid deacylase
LKVGNFADITIFSPEVAAHATMQDPFRFPTGIEYDFTNGEMTIEKGKHTGVLPGLVLRKKS